MTNNGVDELRRCCGGAGYSQWSLLPELFAVAAQMPTIEGDTVVMASQNSRYLFNQIAKNKVSTGLFTYLNDLEAICKSTSQATNVQEFSNLDHIE